MGWTGKTIGAVAGSAFGPLGAVFGAWIGHNYDQESEAAEAAKQAADMDQQAEYHSRLSVFACGVCAAYANNHLHPNEEKRLHILARDIFGPMSFGAINQLIQTVRQSSFGVTECAQAFKGMHPEAQKAMLFEIVSILYADHGYDDSEAHWLEQFVQLTGSNPNEWMDLIRYFDRGLHATFDRAACLQVFGLPPEADSTAIKAAYRRLAREYHPDRLANVPTAVRRLAEEKLQELNAAYEALTKTANGNGVISSLMIKVNTTTLQGAGNSKAGDVAHCFLCDQKNRLPALATMLQARCGKCYALLLLPN